MLDTRPQTMSCPRMLSDPKPHVVGVRWVVKCAEQRQRVEEAKHTVDLELANVAGVNKVRLPSTLTDHEH